MASGIRNAHGPRAPWWCPAVRPARRAASRSTRPAATGMREQHDDEGRPCDTSGVSENAVRRLCCEPSMRTCRSSFCCLRFRQRVEGDHDARFIAVVRFHVMLHPAREQHQQPRSEEHTSELQSHVNLVCRLLLEKKKEYLQT